MSVYLVAFEKNSTIQAPNPEGCWTNSYCETAVTDRFSCCSCTLCLATPKTGSITSKTNRAKHTTVVTHCCSTTHSLSLSATAATALIRLSTTDPIVWISQSLIVCYQMSFLSTLWDKIIKMSMLPTAKRCKNHKRSIWMGSWKHIMTNKQSTWVFLCVLLCVRRSVPMTC